MPLACICRAFILFLSLLRVDANTYPCETEKEGICIGFQEDKLKLDDILAYEGQTVFGLCSKTRGKAGDMFKIKLDEDTVAECNETWSENNSTGLQITNCSKSLVTFVIPNITTSHDGLYKCFKNGRYVESIYLCISKHSLPLSLPSDGVLIDNWQDVYFHLSPNYTTLRDDMVPPTSDEYSCRRSLRDIKISISFSIGCTGDYRPCGCNDSKSLTCCARNITYQHGMVVCLHVKTTNQLGSLEANFTVSELEKRVKPSPVSFLTGKTSSTSANLSWRGPTLKHRLNYSISLKATNLRDNMNYLVVNETSFEVRGLIPHAKYNVTIKGVPFVGGLESDIASIILTVPPSVPARNPKLIPGGFEDRDFDGDHRNVTIYWELMSERFKNGKIRYVVEWVNAAEQVQDTKSSFTFKSPYLKKNESYKISLYAENVNRTIGRNTSLSPEVINLRARDAYGRLGFQVIARKMDGKISVTWDAERVRGVVWCRNGTNGKCGEEELSYETSVAGTPFIMPANDVYMIGVGLSEALGGGIIWAPCIYQNDEGIDKAPKADVKLLPDGNELIIQLLPDIDCSPDRSSPEIVNVSQTVCVTKDGKTCNGERVDDVIEGPQIYKPNNAKVSTGHNYSVRLSYIGVRGRSPEFQTTVFAKPPPSFPSWPIALGGVVLFVVVVVMVFIFKKDRIALICKPLKMTAPTNQTFADLQEQNEQMELEFDPRDQYSNSRPRSLPALDETECHASGDGNVGEESSGTICSLYSFTGRELDQQISTENGEMRPSGDRLTITPEENAPQPVHSAANPSGDLNQNDDISPSTGAPLHHSSDTDSTASASFSTNSSTVSLLHRDGNSQKGARTTGIIGEVDRFSGEAKGFIGTSNTVDGCEDISWNHRLVGRALEAIDDGAFKGIGHRGKDYAKFALKKTELSQPNMNDISLNPNSDSAQNETSVPNGAGIIQNDDSVECLPRLYDEFLI